MEDILILRLSLYAHFQLNRWTSYYFINHNSNCKRMKKLPKPFHNWNILFEITNRKMKILKIFATWWCQLLIFQTFCSSRIHGLRYLRFKELQWKSVFRDQNWFSWNFNLNLVPVFFWYLSDSISPSCVQTNI